MRPDFVDDVLVQVISNLACRFICWCISNLKDFIRSIFTTLLALLKKNIFYFLEGQPT